MIERLMKARNVVLAGAGALVLAACGTSSHDARLNLAPPTETVNRVAPNTGLTLRVVDTRSTDVIGRRGLDGDGGAVLSRDVLFELEQALRAGLQAKGYMIVNDPNVTRGDLTIELETLSFAEQPASAVMRDEQVVASIVAVANGPIGEYRNTYRREAAERQAAASTRSGIDEALNDVLNGVIERLLADTEIDRYLTTP